MVGNAGRIVFRIDSSVLTKEYAHVGHEQSSDSSGAGDDVAASLGPSDVVSGDAVPRAGSGGKPSPDSDR